MLNPDEDDCEAVFDLNNNDDGETLVSCQYNSFLGGRRFQGGPNLVSPMKLPSGSQMNSKCSRTAMEASVGDPIHVGKLGSLLLQPGFYLYISAHGPGGLHGRLAHHLEPTGRPHWHIDYLRAHANPVEVWFCYDRISWECRWANCLSLQRGASVPLAGFGSSDCRCESHLFFFGSRPTRAAFARRLGTFARRHPPGPAPYLRPS